VSRSHGFLLSAAVAQPATRATPITVTGTICRIDTGTGTLELLMGVGHAIRLERIRFQPNVPVKARGASAAISVLAPGAVCRVECTLVDAHETATAVELITPAGAER
jgi:hypothetical protein